MKKPRRSTAGRRAQGPRIGLLTVGETARILGVSPSTLRLWESVGLISPVRSNGRYRLYTPALLEVLKRIKYLRDVKLLNLPGIRQVLGKTPDHAPANGRRPTELGRRLRRLRKKSGLRVVEAAKRAKISAGFLSAIELSRANPSVATLQRLTATYGTTVLDFYDLPKQSNHLVRPRDRRAIQTQSGVRIELLSIGARQLESQMSGTLEIWLDELECHTLHEGDSFLVREHPRPPLVQPVA